jgi:rhamnosyltransferase
MDNIYDIRKERQLQFIFSTEHTCFVPNNEKLGTVAVVVNLYYTEKVEYYSRYLNRMPEYIDLYIFSSKEETLFEVKKVLHHRNTIYVRKKNRGRDLSAFLVSFRLYIDKYDIVCFVHDKKEHAPWLKADVDKWNENLWGNMIASSEYIYNVLQLFEEYPRMGMLFPPEPVGEIRTAWFKASWYENFDNCLQLANKMGLTADIREDKPPIALGSVFWARREVLSKLLEMNWKYTDFPEEPMPNDFTISHAIERVLGYLAQDAGYDTGTIMTEKYASWLLSYLQDYVRLMFSEVSDRIGVDNFNQLRLLSVQKEKLLDYIGLHSCFYLYGAGKQGITVLNLLREKGMEPAGFVVSDGNKRNESIKGLKVYELKDICTESVGIILTVYYHFQEEMIRKLETYGIEDYFIVFDRTCGWDLVEFPS